MGGRYIISPYQPGLQGFQVPAPILRPEPLDTRGLAPARHFKQDLGMVPHQCRLGEVPEPLEAAAPAPGLAPKAAAIPM